MGLKIQRIANSPAYSSESSTLMSARYAHRLAITEVSGQEFTVIVRDFADQKHELDDEAVKRLFDHIWQQVKAKRQSNVVLDLTQIQSVPKRFQRELGYLRRQMRSQGRSARLSNISLMCDLESPLEIV